MGEMRENILGSEPFKALGSHSRVSDMLHGMLELSGAGTALGVALGVLAMGQSASNRFCSIPVALRMC